MDNVSYRNTRPAQQSGTQSPAPAPSPVPQRHPKDDGVGKRSKKSNSKWPKFAVTGLILITLVATIGGISYGISGKSSVGSAIDADKYQVVVLRDALKTPNYFGKLTVIDDKYMRLSDVYYLRQKDTSKDDSEIVQAQNASDYELIKLGKGNEIHGPEDEMIIPIDQILYFENLKTDGQVSKAIAESQTKK